MLSAYLFQEHDDLRKDTRLTGVGCLLQNSRSYSAAYSPRNYGRPMTAFVFDLRQ